MSCAHGAMRRPNEGDADWGHLLTHSAALRCMLVRTLNMKVPAMTRQQIRGSLFALMALVAACLLPVAAAQQPAYTRGAPSADGIGKRYMGREIAHVMGWQGAA